MRPSNRFGRLLSGNHSFGRADSVEVGTRAACGEECVGASIAAGLVASVATEALPESLHLIPDFRDYPHSPGGLHRNYHKVSRDCREFGIMQMALSLSRGPRSPPARAARRCVRRGRTGAVSSARQIVSRPVVSRSEIDGASQHRSPPA